MESTSKLCTRCKAHKPLFDFSNHPAMTSGKQSQCKECFAERARLRRVGRPCNTCGAAMPNDAKVGAKNCDSCMSVCTVCKSAPRLSGQRICSGCQAESDKARKSSADAKLKERITRIRSKYGVRHSLAAALAVFDMCEACGKKSTRPGDMHVDHCHATGKVRGVLCFNCNAALGHVNDNIQRLNQLIGYLSNKGETMHFKDLEKAIHYIQLLIDLEEKKK